MEHQTPLDQKDWDDMIAHLFRNFLHLLPCLFHGGAVLGYMLVGSFVAVPAGWLLDLLLRHKSNTSTRRVAHLSSGTSIKKIEVHTGFITSRICTKPYGWGVLAGFPPFQETVWATSLSELQLRSKVIKAFLGVTTPNAAVFFDIYPGERRYRAWSKAFGPIIRIVPKDNADFIELTSERNPEFIFDFRSNASEPTRFKETWLASIIGTVAMGAFAGVLSYCIMFFIVRVCA